MQKITNFLKLNDKKIIRLLFLITILILLIAIFLFLNKKDDLVEEKLDLSEIAKEKLKIIEKSNELIKAQKIEEKKQEEIEEKYVEILEDSSNFLEKGNILFAEINKNQNPPSSNPDNLMDEYLIYSFNPKSNQKTLIAIIKSAFYRSKFIFSDNKIFFITKKGELASYDFKLNKEKITKISKINSTDEYLGNGNIADFLVDNNKVFYLGGVCGEGFLCAIGSYDLKTTENKILLNNLEKEVNISFNSIAIFKKYDKSNNSLEFLSTGGDGCGGWATLYRFDLAKRNITKLNKVEFNGCEESLDSSNPNSEKVKAENKRYEKFFENNIFCGDFNVNDFLNKIKET